MSLLSECTAATTIVVKNDKGLHTRPSTEIVKCTARFKSDIYLKYRRTEVNAKSLLGILMLAAPRCARIRVIAVGCDAVQAIEALEELSENCFNIQY